MTSLRCCTCPNTDNESDILDSGSTLLSVGEEMVVEDEILDCKKIQLDLLCMRSVIDKYQQKLKVFLDVCPEEPCVSYETELNCSKNKDICELQRNLYKLECQIRELVACCKVAKQELKNLRFLTCQKSKDIYDLQKHIAALESWRRKLELEAGLCIERFEYLKNVKAEWSEVTDMLQTDKDCFSKIEQKFVPRKCYVKDKRFFIHEIEKLKQMFRELYELQNANFTYSRRPDSPVCLSELKLAEKEYMALKTKFNEMKYGKGEDDDGENDCK